MMMIGGQKLERFRFFYGSIGRYGLGSKVMGVLCFVPNQLFSCTHSKADVIEDIQSGSYTWNTSGYKGVHTVARETQETV